MKIFIAGATGVLGRALVPLLIQKGTILRSLARTTDKARALELAGVEAVHGDLLDQATIRELPAMVDGCEAVVHIATAIPQDPSQPAPQAWETTKRLRTEGTRSLLQAALAAGVRRYIQQSITMAYPDRGDEWIDESTPLDASPERASICRPVIEMEELVSKIAPEQLQWCILRGGSFVGSETVQDLLLRQMRTGSVTIPCNGNNYVSHVHVHDMANAIAIALEKAPPGSTFNIVSEPLRNGDYIDTIANILGVPHLQHLPSQPCPPSQRCSNRAARSILGWTLLHDIWPSLQQVAENQ